MHQLIDGKGDRYHDGEGMDIQVSAKSGDPFVQDWKGQKREDSFFIKRFGKILATPKAIFERMNLTPKGHGVLEGFSFSGSIDLFGVLALPEDQTSNLFQGERSS